MGYNYEYDLTYTTQDIDDSNYQTDLLNVFNISEFDNNVINNTINDIYTLVKDNDNIMEIIRKSNGRFMTTDNEVGLMGLFAYDYFLRFHYILKEFNKNKTILKTNVHYINLI